MRLYQFDVTLKMHGYGTVEAQTEQEAKKRVEAMDWFELYDTELISVISVDSINQDFDEID